jgi:hypothetical protein
MRRTDDEGCPCATHRIATHVEIARAKLQMGRAWQFARRLRRVHCLEVYNLQPAPRGANGYAVRPDGKKVQVKNKLRRVTDWLSRRSRHASLLKD